MTDASSIAPNDGKSTPQLGPGAWQTTDNEVITAVSHILEIEYWHVSTVTIYRNEMGVEHVIAASSLPRDEIFVTTKLWNKDQGRDLVCPGLEQSLEKLGLDHVDLYLIHWSCPACGTYMKTWEQLIDFRSEDLIRSIGVRNFLPEHLDTIIDGTGITPVVNQIELHPTFQPDDLINHCSGLRITVGGWSPLGQATDLEHPVITRIVERFGTIPAQVIIRWYLDRGFVIISKSGIPAWIELNFAALEMELSTEDRAAIDTLSTGDRTSPDSVTLEMVRLGVQLAEAPPVNKPFCTRHVEGKWFDVMWRRWTVEPP